ncbi:MAG: hypothetical protein ACPGN3_11755 [Opitutales bacterium]
MSEANLIDSFPVIYQTSQDLHGQLLPVAFLCTGIGLAVRVFKGSFGDPSGLVRAVLSACIVAVCISQFALWVNSLQLAAHSLVESMDVNPADTNRRYAELVLGAQEENAAPRGFWDILWSDDAGFGEAITYALIFLSSQLAWALSYLLKIVQQVILVYSISLSPVFLSFFLIDYLRPMAGRFIMTIVSVGLCPLGWAIADQLTDALMQMAVGTENTLAGNSQALFFVIVLTLWILFSSIAAPLVIIKILSQGADGMTTLLSGFGSSVSQGAAYGAGGAVATHMMGAGPIATSASAFASGVAGVASGAAGRSNMLVPSMIGLSLGAASSSTHSSGSYTDRAREIFEKS